MIIHIALVMAAFIAVVYMIPAFIKAIAYLVVYGAVALGIGWLVVTVANHRAAEQELLKQQAVQQQSLPQVPNFQNDKPKIYQQ